MQTFKYDWVRLQEYVEDGVLKRQIDAGEEGKWFFAEHDCWPDVHFG